MDMAEMMRLAAVPATQLLAETRAALILVDVQNRFLTERVLGPIEMLLQSARAHDIPRFYVSVGRATGASDSAPWLRRVADLGVDLKARAAGAESSACASAIPAALAPQPDEVHLTKWRTSAFFETGLPVLLRSAGIETAVLGGIASYGSIIASYIDAIEQGFFPLLCADAIDGADPVKHAAAMEVMGANSRLAADDVVRVWNAKSPDG